MARCAFLFPGQGGQFVGQGRDFLTKEPLFADLFQKAEAISKLPLKEISLNGPLDELNKPSFLQPAILTLSLALAKTLEKEGATPLIAAGHSLGEYGALALAGALTDEEALALVSARGRFCEKAAASRPGAMAAILNVSGEETAKLCDLALAVGEVAPANFNTPTQTVVSGEVKAVSAVVRYAEMKNGKALILPITGAYHSPLMADAAKDMRELILATDFKKPRLPVVPNAIGQAESDPGRLKELLMEQLTAPVHWVQTSASLLAANPEEFVECWPKLYVGSLVKKCLPKDALIPFRVLKA
ncbi:MAG: ACP S-malonyltransferase [Deltaproteobacteria bacterium]|jgi:[acyl-carrier-protein] S-malonyltransferase|nr:ACP S-malonyltransferase [Deltaproteobacteria bacterium]